MVIIEGPDGAGKTTLVTHLATKFGMAVGERGVANRDFLYKVTRKDTYRALAQAVRGDDHPHIWDRLFVSEFVYHGIYPGRPNEFSPYETRFIGDVLNALACPVIVCLPPYEVVRLNALTVHQMEGVKKGLPEIYLAYRDDDLPWPHNTLWYDYTNGTKSFAALEDLEEEVAGYIEERQRRSSAWAA